MSNDVERLKAELAAVTKAARILAEHVDVYRFYAGHTTSHACRSCDWDSLQDGSSSGARGHHPGCELRAALDIVEGRCDPSERWTEI